MFGFTIISKERLHRLEEQALSSESPGSEYTKAYNAGYEAGCQDTLHKIRMPDPWNTKE